MTLRLSGGEFPTPKLRIVPPHRTEITRWTLQNHPLCRKIASVLPEQPEFVRTSEGGVSAGDPELAVDAGRL